MYVVSKCIHNLNREYTNDLHYFQSGDNPSTGEIRRLTALIHPARSASLGIRHRARFRFPYKYRKVSLDHLKLCNFDSLGDPIAIWWIISVEGRCSNKDVDWNANPA